MKVDLRLVFFLYFKWKNDFLTIYLRLHREALKQSATDPLSGKIDVGILTTGLSMAARKRRGEITAAIKKHLLSKQPRPPSMLQAKLLQELNQASQIVSCWLFFYVKYLRM